MTPMSDHPSVESLCTPFGCYIIRTNNDQIKMRITIAKSYLISFPVSINNKNDNEKKKNKKKMVSDIHVGRC